MHFIVYAGFIIINLEVLEIVLDGVLGTHRLFSGFIGSLYLALIDAFEILAAGVFLACFIFFCRRNILKLRRFISHDLDGWPRSDANYILLTEMALMALFLTMNAADTLLQSRGYGHYGTHLTGDFIFSRWSHPLLNGLSNGSLVILERSCWWLHILGILAFLNYLPYSKHLNILIGHHLEKEFIAGPPGRISVAELFLAQHGITDPDLVEDGGKCPGDLLSSLVIAAGTTYPKQDLRIFPFCREFGHRRYMHTGDFSVNLAIAHVHRNLFWKAGIRR